ncbi:MAG: T9SS type A sorting domain-containing protein [Bacteroidota bacterium]|nr:T9SS type A sorting domain-containing protein [Bacteroidota bacterium]
MIAVYSTPDTVTWTDTLDYPQCHCPTQLPCGPEMSITRRSDGNTLYWSQGEDSWMRVPFHSASALPLRPNPPDLPINGIRPEWVWNGGGIMEKDSNSAAFRVDFSAACPVKGCLYVAVDDFCDVYLYSGTMPASFVPPAPWLTPCTGATPPPGYIGTAMGAFTSGDVSLPPSNIFELNLPAGDYTIVLIAWDGGRCPPSPLLGPWLDPVHQPGVHNRALNGLAYSLGLCMTCNCPEINLDRDANAQECCFSFDFVNVNPFMLPCDRVTIETAPGATVNFASAAVSPPLTWASSVTPALINYTGIPLHLSAYAGVFKFCVLQGGRGTVVWRMWNDTTELCKGTWDISCDTCHTMHFEQFDGECRYRCGFRNNNPTALPVHALDISIVSPAGTVFTSAERPDMSWTVTPPVIPPYVTGVRYSTTAAAVVPGAYRDGFKFQLSSLAGGVTVIRWRTWNIGPTGETLLCEGFDTLGCEGAVWKDTCAFVLTALDTCCCFVGTIINGGASPVDGFRLDLLSEGAAFEPGSMPEGMSRIPPWAANTLNYQLIPPLNPHSSRSFNFCLRTPRNRIVVYSWSIRLHEAVVCEDTDSIHCCLDTCTAAEFHHSTAMSRVFNTGFRNLNPYLEAADEFYLYMLTDGGRFQTPAGVPEGWTGIIAADGRSVSFSTPTSPVALGARSGDFVIRVQRNCLSEIAVPHSCSVDVGWRTSRGGRALCCGTATLSWLLWDPHDPHPYFDAEGEDSCSIRIRVRKPDWESDGIYSMVVVGIATDDEDDELGIFRPSGSRAPTGWQIIEGRGLLPSGSVVLQNDHYSDHCSWVCFETATEPVMDTTGKEFFIATLPSNKSRILHLYALSGGGDAVARDSIPTSCMPFSACDRAAVHNTGQRHCYNVTVFNEHVPESGFNTVRLLVPEEGVLILSVNVGAGAWKPVWVSPSEVILTSVAGVAPGNFVEFDLCLGVSPTLAGCRLIWQTAQDGFYLCSGIADVDITLGALSGGKLNRFDLFQNYPNPFNRSTSLVFSVGERAHVKIEIYDACGRIVGAPVDEIKDAGLYTVKWDASRLSSGIYALVMRSGSFFAMKRITLLR